MRLAEFDRLTKLGDDLQAAGNGPQAQRIRGDANVALQSAHKSVDDLIARAKEGQAVIDRLQPRA